MRSTHDRPAMEIGIALEPLQPEADAAEYIAIARDAEALGFAGVFASDHLIHGQGRSFMEPLTLLACVAGATQRIRVGTSVLVLPYRNPVIVAAQAATLDRLTGGRFVLTLAAGWDAEEFQAVGVDPAERGARTDDHLAVLKKLFQGDPVRHDGRFTTLRGARIGVLPATPGGPPIWIGGDSDAALRRVLRFGEAWHGYDVSPERLRQVRARLDALAPSTGRDPGTVALTGVLVADGEQDAGALGQRLDELAREGLSLCSLSLPAGATAVRRSMQWVAEQVVPRAGAAVQLAAGR
jgi:probable F420-dependent oxidoreductase